MTDLYKRLGLTYTASADEIKETYRSLAKKYHPDVSTEPNAEDHFIEITEAYEILGNPQKRRRYDLTRFSPSPNLARERKQKIYEEYVRKSQQKARSNARVYSQKKYEKFDHEYFDSVAQYYVPKFLGCFGISIVAILVLTIAGAFLLQFENGAAILFLLMMVVIAAAAYASTMFDIWHDKRQRYRKTGKERSEY
ncbi:MAG: DnaJ domain-containing protein [Flavobacteriales bacterium]